MNRRAMRRFFRNSPRLAAAALLPAALLACSSQPQDAAPRPPLEGAAIGGPFTLADKSGKTVRWDDFKGSYRIVYFGYTFCPDACPTDVQAMMRGFALFEKQHPDLARQVQPIFISIDPQRDGPKEVGQFAAAFHPRLMGLTGTPAQVEAAAKAFAVYYQKGGQTAGGYLMDHSRVAFLMGREGQPLATLPVDQKPDAVAAELAKWVK